MNLRDVVFIILVLISLPSAIAKNPSVRFCSHKFLSHDQYSVSTEEFVIYLKILIEQGEIKIDDLQPFLAGLLKGKLINPIVNQNQSKTQAFHQEQFEKMIAESSGLDLKKIAGELEQIKMESEVTEKQKNQTQNETKIAHFRMTFAPIPAGEFMMGEKSGIKKVTIARSFEIMSTDVTQYMWVELMGENPSEFKNSDGSMKPNHPVEMVTWYSAAEFANRLSIKHGLPPVYDFSKLKFDPGTRPEDGTWALIRNKEGKITEEDQYKNIIINAPEGDITQAKGFRLPTEEEQEYVMSNLGRSKGRYHFGESASELKDYAWYSENSNKQTHAVMEKKPLNINGNLIYDIIGNVLKWSHSNYEVLPANRITRGGSWAHDALYLRAAYRDYITPGMRWKDTGFRLVKTSP